MKAIILLTIFVAQSLAFSPATKEQVRQYYDDCGTEHEVTAERLAQFKSGTFEHDDISKVFLFCVAHKIGTVDLEEHIIVDQLAQQLHVYNADKTVEDITVIVNRCNQAKKGSAGARTLKAFGCLRKAGLKTTYAELFA